MMPDIKFVNEALQKAGDAVSADAEKMLEKMKAPSPKLQGPAHVALTDPGRTMLRIRLRRATIPVPKRQPSRLQRTDNPSPKPL